MSASITFEGGAGTVTGANFLLERAGKKLLVDCGLMQGQQFAEEFNYKDFPYNPAKIDALFVTHAHTDHIGRIPRLVAKGFQGPIYSTKPTKDIAAVMFEDALSIMQEEAKENDREPLYDKKDIEQALSLWQAREYHEEMHIDDIIVRFLNAGHILGSAMVEFTRGGKKVLFTGDLGNQPAPIVRETEPIENIQYLVMESVYGDRVHEEDEERLPFFARLIDEVRNAGGTLLIPAFSLQRTQAVLHDLNHLIEHGHIKPIDVYLDAPLAIRLLDIYRAYPQEFNAHLRERLEAGDDPFSFRGLDLTPHIQDSRAIAKADGPKIIIAGSGMSHGGRIREHERTFLGREDTTILFVGHQAAGSLGRRLQEGEKKVKIDDDWVRVRARALSLTGYSAHMDREQLLDFVAQTADTLEHVFVTMGEPKSALFLTQRLHDFLDVQATAPTAGETCTIEW